MRIFSNEMCNVRNYSHKVDYILVKKKKNSVFAISEVECVLKLTEDRMWRLIFEIREDNLFSLLLITLLLLSLFGLEDRDEDLYEISL